ncbi:MAG: ABC-2 type transport system permease protein [Bacteroidia bacterium]|jgi:ABC-2 type transport system permease protein
MGKIGLITWREYSTRVRKKSFIIMTILAPILIAAFYGTIIFLVGNDDIGKETQVVQVFDDSGYLGNQLTSTDDLIFEYTKGTPGKEIDSGYSGRLIVPDKLELYNPEGILYESSQTLSIQNKSKINDEIERTLTKEKMLRLKVSKASMDSLRTKVSIKPVILDKEGKSQSSSTELNTAIGMIFSFIIYMFIFIYGVQVMRGVIEEKTNRIVEVIISSVKPFELMMGKVLGIAMVGLTQIFIWILLSGGLILALTMFKVGNMEGIQEIMSSSQSMTPEQIGELSKSDTILHSVANLNFKFIFVSFIIYFLGGYLTYSALFAAVGAAVDAETDTQQFMFPITMPLVFSIVLSTSVVMRDPNGTLSFWLSIIPLSSPIVMMVRAPFLNLQEQWWEVVLSMTILFAFFCFVIYLAGRIYRTGILMYGKKTSYKELFKWLFYKG